MALGRLASYEDVVGRLHYGPYWYLREHVLGEDHAGMDEEQDMHVDNSPFCKCEPDYSLTADKVIVIHRRLKK